VEITYLRIRYVLYPIPEPVSVPARALLCRTGSVDEFCGKFMALSCRDLSLTEGQQIQLFTTGLGKPLRTNVALKQLRSLDAAVMFARTYEQRLVAQGATAPATRTSTRATSKPWTAPTPAATSTGSVNQLPYGRASTSRKFSPAKISDRRTKGMCFKCDEHFVPSHRDVCKRLFLIELLDDDDMEESPTISLHAITRIQPRSGRTMQVLVIVNGAHLSALLDSGSTHNFVDSTADTCTGIQLTAQHGLHVAVANGNQVPSLGCCKDLQWLKSLGHILWDLANARSPSSGTDTACYGQRHQHLHE
jgi:hypothetical protein